MSLFECDPKFGCVKADARRWTSLDYRTLGAVCRQAKAEGRGYRWAIATAARVLSRSEVAVEDKLSMRGWYCRHRKPEWGFIPADGRLGARRAGQ